MCICPVVMGTVTTDVWVKRLACVQNSTAQDCPLKTLTAFMCFSVVALKRAGVTCAHPF